MPEPTPKSYEAQVHTVGDPEGVFTGNMLRFATKEEADQYVKDLAMRWTAVEDVRVIGSDDEVSHEIVNSELRKV